MDNKQLRTAMVTRQLTKLPEQQYFDWDQSMDELIESCEKVVAWRGTLGLDLSIASRGSSEKNWYVDLMMNPQTGWRELIELFQISLSLMVSIKKPKKVLSFSPDVLFVPYVKSLDSEDFEIHFANNLSLFYFENHFRDDSLVVNSKPFRDIDYAVVSYDEIGSGESTGYDLINGINWEFAYDEGFLLRCIDALAPGGVLLITSTNNSGKLYRDDYQFHPMNDIHDVLKSANGGTFHNSEAYGYTVFVKE